MRHALQAGLQDLRSIVAGMAAKRMNRCQSLGGLPHPVIGTIGDSSNYIRVLIYSYYTAITGWILLSQTL